MRRLPLIPTLIVLLAVPTMVALGFWQLRRAEWKDALLAQLAAHAEAPLLDAPAELAARRDALSFRRVRVACAAVEPRDPSAARSADGVTGYRQTILCRRAAGEPLLVSVGVATDPGLRLAVAPGATFTGRLVPRDGAPAFLLVAERAAGTLAPEVPPSIDTIPNSHRGYAVQWFAFALVLSVIYALYLRRRKAGDAS